MKSVMLKSLVQSAVRWALPFVYGAIGYEPTVAAANEIVAFLVALVLFVISLVWSYFDNKKLIKTPPSIMPMLLVACAPLLVLNVGCASSSPARDYLIAQESYNLVVEGMTDLARADLLTLEEAEDFEIARVHARRILNRWHAAIVAGESFDGGDLITMLDELTAELIRQRHQQPTTRKGVTHAVRPRQRPRDRHRSSQGRAVGHEHRGRRAGWQGACSGGHRPSPRGW